MGNVQYLNDLAQLLCSWADKDMDSMIVPSGIKGSGKSTFAIQLAREYLKVKFGLEKKECAASFDVQRYVAYDYDDIFDKINELGDGEPLLIDEAVNVMMGEDWAKAESKEMKKVFAKLRTRHLLTFICIPDLWWLDNKYRENLVTFWAHIYQRGGASIFLPTLTPAMKDRWNRDYFLKLKTHWSYFTPIDSVRVILQRHPNFFAFVDFPPVPAPIYQKYLELRNAAILRVKQVQKKPHRAVILKWGLDYLATKSAARVAEANKVDASTINYYLQATGMLHKVIGQQKLSIAPPYNLYKVTVDTPDGMPVVSDVLVEHERKFEPQVTDTAKLQAMPITVDVPRKPFTMPRLVMTEHGTVFMKPDAPKAPEISLTPTEEKKVDAIINASPAPVEQQPPEKTAKPNDAGHTG